MENIISFESAVYKENIFNPERLKAARTYRGLSVTELASRLDMQRQRLSMYENNRIDKPEILVIRKIAEALDFPVKFFLEKDINRNDSSAIYFRSLLSTNKRYKDEQIQKIKFITIIYEFLSEYIEFPALNIPKIPTGLDIEDAANYLRDFWKLKRDEINNLVYIVEKNGIIVTNFETETGDVDAYSKKLELNSEQKFIVGYSNNKNTAARIHFDIAHELGHILLHDWYIDDESLETEFKIKESEAHRFASAFLLPKEEFILDIGRNATKLSYYTEMKKRWKVSISAMILRSYSLGLIEHEDYQRLMKTMTKRGMRKNEPLDDMLVTASPTLLRDSVAMLLDAGILTPSEFLNELSVNYSLSLNPEEIETLLSLRRGILNQIELEPDELLKIKKFKR